MSVNSGWQLHIMHDTQRRVMFCVYKGLDVDRIAKIISKNSGRNWKVDDLCANNPCPCITRPETHRHIVFVC